MGRYNGPKSCHASQKTSRLKGFVLYVLFSYTEYIRPLHCVNENPFNGIYTMDLAIETWPSLKLIFHENLKCSACYFHPVIELNSSFIHNANKNLLSKALQNVKYVHTVKNTKQFMIHDFLRHFLLLNFAMENNSSRLLTRWCECKMQPY